MPAIKFTLINGTVFDFDGLRKTELDAIGDSLRLAIQGGDAFLSIKGPVSRVNLRVDQISSVEVFHE